jgi:hypothetical protein
MRWASSGKVADRGEDTQLQLPLIAGVLSIRLGVGFDVMLFSHPKRLVNDISASYINT